MAQHMAQHMVHTAHTAWSGGERGAQLQGCGVHSCCPAHRCPCRKAAAARPRCITTQAARDNSTTSSCLQPGPAHTPSRLFHRVRHTCNKHSAGQKPLLLLLQGPAGCAHRAHPQHKLNALVVSPALGEDAQQQRAGFFTVHCCGRQQLLLGRPCAGQAARQQAGRADAACCIQPLAVL